MNLRVNALQSCTGALNTRGTGEEAELCLAVIIWPYIDALFKASIQIMCWIKA